MKKKICITIVLCLVGLRLFPQYWAIDYLGDYPMGRTHIYDGFVDKDGVTFLAGQTGPDKDTPEAFLMRIEPDGNHVTFTYHHEGCLSKATSMVEMSNQQLFVAGNLYDTSSDDVLVLIFDKHLHLLEERRYAKEVEALSFGPCVAAVDKHDHVIVATSVKMENEFNGTDDYGVLYKFNPHGNLVSHRYLIEDYPDPLFFIKDFHLRQMWYKEDETLLCLAPGYGGVMAFITFDSAFNYIEEHQIWRYDDQKSDHTLHYDAYTDHWYSEDDALFFSSRGDDDHNDLRISHINTQGDYLEYIRLTQEYDTIYDAAIHRCMATTNDSNIYFSFCYHTYPLYPGVSGVYRINHDLEITGRYLRNDCENYRAALILPTADNGCIVVNHFSPWMAFEHTGHPFIERLSTEDFEEFPSVVNQMKNESIRHLPFPNPSKDVITIPTLDFNGQIIRFQIIDSQGLPIIDKKIGLGTDHLQIDVSDLSTGLYYYRIYTQDKTLLTEKFIKK